MQIVFLGNFEVPFSSENHHALSLESLGHQVIKLQENKIDTNAVLAHALQSNIFVWVHTHGWNTPGKKTMKEVLNILRVNKIPTISYHLDLYMGIERWNEYKDSPLFDIDHFFTADPQMAKWLNDNTNCKGHFVPAGVYDKECYIADVPVTRDIIFVGSRGYHHEWPWRPQLIDWLKETYKDKFEHYGGDGLGVVRGATLNKLYASTKIVIGDTLSPNFDYPYYFSDRLFETTGRGGFILFPGIKGLDNYFELGKELITYKFGDFEGLKKTIDCYLKEDELREEIRKAGHERTKRDHTYKNRWQEILEIINGK